MSFIADSIKIYVLLCNNLTTLKPSDKSVEEIIDVVKSIEECVLAMDKTNAALKANPNFSHFFDNRNNCFDLEMKIYELKHPIFTLASFLTNNIYIATNQSTLYKPIVWTQTSNYFIDVVSQAINLLRLDNPEKKETKNEAFVRIEPEQLNKEFLLIIDNIESINHSILSQNTMTQEYLTNRLYDLASAYYQLHQLFYRLALSFQPW